MQPFVITEPCLKLIDHYPASDMLSIIAKAMSKEEREYFLRLWLSEGIPSAFLKAPIIYELVREWLGKKLSIHPKEITIVGSARIGYSLSPQPKYGQPFGAESDLDFAVVSERLFSDLSKTFFQWKIDFEKSLVHPRNPREESFWASNIDLLPKNIARGFIDAKKIPSWDRYPLARDIQNWMAILQKKMTVTPAAPHVKSASIRVYRNWDTFIRQVCLTFEKTLQTLE